MATKNVIEGSDKVSASQLKDFFRQIDDGSINGNHIQALLERRNPFGHTLELKCKPVSINPVSTNENLYEIEVDGTKTINELIEQGNFNFRYGNLEKSTLSKKYLILNKSTRKIQIQLFHFKDNIETTDIIKKMAKNDFSPSTIEELLSLGIQKPELQVLYNIVSLGSVNCDNFSDNDVEAPYLVRGHKGISLADASRGSLWKHYEVFKYQFAGSKIII